MGTVSFFYYPYASRTLEKNQTLRIHLAVCDCFHCSLDASIELLLMIALCCSSRSSCYSFYKIPIDIVILSSVLLPIGEVIIGLSQISHPSKSVPKDNSIALVQLLEFILYYLATLDDQM
ncbi:AVN_collapsed_G0046720.mRNA.1.CDS.1 [Saccharomyces cerevisiae]|nr:AVN_collapsed_G0046720.mRNA.1.CDS.1 [Saccharomyces cerevisiae]